MNNTIMVWAFFVLGQILCILKRASFAIRGPNAVKTRWDYVKVYWDIMLIRAAVGVIIFWLWASYPSILNTVASKFGLNYELTIPVIPPVALCFGLFVDVILDWISSHIPAMQRQLPQLDTTTAPAANSAAAGK
jgi:hypothetical protein